MNYGGIFDADTKEKRLNELLVKTNDSSFWTSAEKDSVMLEIKDLKSTLSVRESGGIYITTIQKFCEDIAAVINDVNNMKQKTFLNVLDEI